MARKTLIHKHTNLTTSTGGVLSPKLPTVGTLEKGEIAVNYKNGYETLSIENDAGEVIPFASLEQTMAYTDASVVNADWNATSGKAEILNKPDIPDERLSSSYQTSTLENDNLLLAGGDTYETAFSKMEKAILDNEETIAASLNDLNTRKIEIDDVPTKTSQLTNDSNFTTLSEVTLTIVNSAPTTLDTLKELADALGNDANFATTVATQIGNKADKSSMTAGTYRSVTVNNQGIVTGGTNPTTLAGYGITDAINTSSTALTKAGDLTAAKFIKLGGTSSQFLKADGSVDSNTYLTSHLLLKTINNESLIGSGNITIQGGSGGSGDENVIEIVKVNGTALTPDANKAVNITVPTPYIMECSGSGSSVTIEEHAYETLSNAISEGRDVYLKKGSYLYALNVYGEDYLYFTHTSGEELFIESVVVYSDDTAESFLNFLRSAYIGGSDVALGAGDKLVITDASHNNYISRSPITFDGSTTTKALTPKGTWEPFLKTAPVTSVNGQTGEVSLTIPSAVTESTVSGWGFTKNTGTYSKPSGGIPKTDLASAIQTSLGLADTALQSHQNIKSLNTNNTTAQTANASEAIAGSGTINLHKVAKTGTYSDLIGTPTIPAAVTESTVSGWGFTKNAGTITGITMNGSSKGTSGVVNLGTVLTEHLTLKTINNESIVGSGNLTVSGLPTVSASDNSKILLVVNGAWALVTPTAIYSGTSTPNNSTGNDGDLYLQTS